MKRKLVALFLVVIMISSLTACGLEQTKKVKLDPDNPVVLNLWHYYNSIQLQGFDEMISNFNETVGAEEGIVIEAHSMGSVGELTDAVMSSINGEVGAEELPDIYAAYTDTAYEADKKGLLADLNEYITADEQAEYIDAYMEEGHLDGGDSLKLFPIAKSTESLLLNETAWDEFAAETGADKSKLSTWEGVVELAKQYYDWTDAKTPDVADDGKAFFGRDAVANYMIVGSMQLGTEMFQVKDGEVACNLDEKVLRKLWDCYYVPFVEGWFGAYGKFRSDDIKTGQIICLVGSTSGALYFPTEVTSDDGTSTPIKGGAYTLPNFEGTEPYAVQQGAGYVVTKSTPEKEYAATVFLKWFTETENNVKFAVESGYYPVKKEANNKEILEKAVVEDREDGLLKANIDVGVDMIDDYNLYTSKAFTNGNAARNTVQNEIQDAAVAAVEERDKLMASGMSKEDAVAQLTSDKVFTKWLSTLRSDMDAAIQGK